MFVLDIDYREAKILKLIDDNIDIKISNNIVGPICKFNITFYYRISNLNVGDFLIIKEQEQLTEENQEQLTDGNQEQLTDGNQEQLSEEKESNNKIKFIIERKSINDLACSIVDNRFKEQKSRLSQTNNSIIYIIEGNISKCKSKIPHSTLKSSIINLMCKNNFLVFKTDSELDTLEYLLLLYKKVNNNELEMNDNKVTVPGKKKNEIQNSFINQLTVINGVSIVVAQKIHEIYKNMKDLVEAYEMLDTTDCENLLSNIQINEKRKVGKALSKKIYHSLTN
jgi:crossover junction endonuclease MUS81